MRLTTVHSRFHVVGLLCGEWSLVDTCQRKVEAVAVGARALGDGYDRVQVFDSMARRSAPSTWDVSADGVATEAAA